MSQSEHDRVFKGRRPPIRWDTETSEQILSYLRDLAHRLGKNTITSRDVKNDGKISPATIFRRFGGFSEALIKANLRPHRTYKRNRNIMLDELYLLMEKLNRFPSKSEVNKNLNYNSRHFDLEFGSLQKACELVAASKSSGNKPDISKPPPFEVPLTRSTTRRRYGAALDFRGLRHAPINEQGVVFLFGMLSEKLGFVVESIQSGFPDCDAKLIRADGTFEGVRIEFEFRSSDFSRHKHDPQGCDILVCWLHDWPECPIEVISLSDVVERLKHE